MRIWSSQVVSRLEKDDPVTLKTVARLCAERSGAVFNSFNLSVGCKVVLESTS